MKKKIWICFMACLLALTSSFTVFATSKYDWSAKVAPNYVKVIGKAKVSGKPKKGKIKYSSLDKLGRPGKVTGNITYAMVKKSAGWREEIKVDPAGWPKKNPITAIKLYNGKQYRGYFWNRSHLIADSLGGRPIKKNLITGTRMQNVGANDGKGGMAYTERKAVNWLYEHHKGTVYYRATPIYKGKEIIPRSVIVDIQTSDKSINQRVIVYNAANGYKINYKKATRTKTKETSYDEPETPPVSETVFITATGTKYHTSSSCNGLKNAKKVYKTTLKEAKADGYEPCALCGH